MKNYFKGVLIFTVSITLFLSSCKVEPEIPIEPPNYALKISINQLPATPNVLDGLSAIISLTKENGETFLTDKVYELTYNGSYNTSKIQVPKGSYKLVKFVIKKADGSIIFASPIAGSPKAAQITKPLAISVNTLTNTTILNPEVLTVTATDRAQDFGYIDGTFNEIEKPVTEFSLIVRPSFKIGDVLYDSIPVSLKLTTYPLQGEPHTAIHALAAGAKKITLSKQAIKYTISINKWGMQDTAIILPDNMKDGITYSLGGNKAPKKIKFESTYKQAGNSWIADTRKEYLYTNSGKLDVINHYRKAADHSSFLEMKEEITYENNRISQIRKSKNNHVSFYTYKDNGKLNEIRYTDNEGKTTGKVNHLNLPNQNNYSIGAVFESTKYYYKQHYSYELLGGNVFQYTYATSHGDSESTNYEYDFGINPFIHLQLPDLGFVNLSKNNVTKRYATYIIDIPQFDAYSYSYVYDSEGYPIEIYTKYRVPGTATEAFTTKTVLNYY